MADLVDQMAEAIATALNGGEFNDGKWYSEDHRTAWCNAVRPYALLNGGEFNDGKWYSEDHRTAWCNAVRPYALEIYRLRQNLQLAKSLIESSGKYKFEIVSLGGSENE